MGELSKEGREKWVAGKCRMGVEGLKGERRVDEELGRVKKEEGGSRKRERE